ncbi:MAG: hypothetical protein DRJ66_00930 [Thermoprotei archaeon]|nr:MAG: hypothetical protein DRJ66_00930 [Thermoprotei archaeon]RLF17695.1 MAG: hypothetical protein DRZ82_09615 [Thermoprotei archaeon]
MVRLLSNETLYHSSSHSSSSSSHSSSSHISSSSSSQGSSSSSSSSSIISPLFSRCLKYISAIPPFPSKNTSNVHPFFLIFYLNKV